jgi:hypothetical protein
VDEYDERRKRALDATRKSWRDTVTPGIAGVCIIFGGFGLGVWIAQGEANQDQPLSINL